MGKMIELKAADGTVVPAYEARPAGTPKGAVVVIQEIFGVNSHIRQVADAGADTFVAGSAIFGKPDYKAVIDQMRVALA
mgnify:CR=1 FL=1